MNQGCWNLFLLALRSEVFLLPPVPAAARKALRLVLQSPHPEASVSMCNADPWAPVTDSASRMDLGICILSKLS